MQALIHASRICGFAEDGATFAVASPMHWEPCGAEITERHTWNGIGFDPPETDNDDVKEKAKTKLQHCCSQAVPALLAVEAARISGTDPDPDDQSLVVELDEEAKAQKEIIEDE